MSEPVAYDPNQMTSVANRSNPKPGDPCHPLVAAAPPLLIWANQTGHEQHLLPLTSSAVASPARTSALRDAVRALMAHARDSGTSSVASLASSFPHGCSSRTSLAFVPLGEDGTLPSSFAGWRNSGTWGPGGAWTLSTSVWPSDGSESSCSLAEILEPDVPQKYWLSPKACQGILRRAERRGKTLPAALAAALQARGAEGTT